MPALPSTAFRTFTPEQSSAIYNLHVEDEGFVEVIFHSNTSKAYGFAADQQFAADLIKIMSYSDLPVSIGRLIAQARKNGNLSPIVVDDGMDYHEARYHHMDP